jgi:hypothetical protein
VLVHEEERAITGPQHDAVVLGAKDIDGIKNFHIFSPGRWRKFWGRVLIEPPGLGEDMPQP